MKVAHQAAVKPKLPAPIKAILLDMVLSYIVYCFPATRRLPLFNSYYSASPPSMHEFSAGLYTSTDSLQFFLPACLDKKAASRMMKQVHITGGQDAKR